MADLVDHPVFRAANIGTSFKTVRDAYGYCETLLGSRYRTFRIRKQEAQHSLRQGETLMQQIN